MLVKEINLADYPALLVADAEQRDRRMLHAMRNAARQAESVVVDKTAKISDTGLLMQGWQVNDTKHGAELVNDAPYAVIVEEGSRPHWPPFFPILEYLGRKKGVSTTGLDDPGLTGKYGMPGHPWFGQSPEREELRLHALSVCRAIAAKGTQPRRILGGSQGEFAAIIEEAINEALQ